MSSVEHIFYKVNCLQAGGSIWFLLRLGSTVSSQNPSLASFLKPDFLSFFSINFFFKLSKTKYQSKSMQASPLSQKSVIFLSFEEWVRQKDMVFISIDTLSCLAHKCHTLIHFPSLWLVLPLIHVFVFSSFDSCQFVFLPTIPITYYIFSSISCIDPDSLFHCSV